MATAARCAFRQCRLCRATPAASAITGTAIRSRRNRDIQSQRNQSTDANNAASSSPKVSGIVDQISQLTLLETADLVSALKTRLNIPDIPMGGFMGGGAPGAGAAPAAAAAEEDEPAPKQEERTLFNLKLKAFDAAAKPKVIKEIKSMLGLSLVDSKKFAESVPKMMKESVAKDEGEKIIETMKAIGAEVVME
ncbi:MAG: hypothetical protein Q9159_001370 [Coniocarpon cinnabarinum]